MIDNIVDQLKRDEGLKLMAYKDSLGFWTIGYGHKITDVRLEPSPVLVGWTAERAEAVLVDDVLVITKKLRSQLPWIDDLDVVRRGVLQNMAFNMGVYGLLKFHNTLAAFEREDWQAASAGMLDSLWAKQVGARAERLSKQVLTGDWQ